MVFRNKSFRIISWIFVMLWMILIFYLSHQPATASNELSTGILDVIIQTSEKIVPFIDSEWEGLHSFIRKSAHFFAYFILSLLVVNALRRSVGSIMYECLLAVGICILYAISDEVHQLFIPGRSGELRDVFIDTAGSSVGIAVYLFALQLIKRMMKKHG